MKKEIFVKEIEDLLTRTGTTLSTEAAEYFNALQITNEKSAVKFTENGKIVLQFMQNNYESYKGMFKAKDFENAGVTSRTASGALQKLTNDGYVEKVGKNPVIYVLTEKGKTADMTTE